MTKTLEIACIMLWAAAWQTSYLTGHVSNLGRLCSTLEEPKRSVG